MLGDNSEVGDHLACGSLVLRRDRHARPGAWWRRRGRARLRRARRCRASRPTSATAARLRYWAETFRPELVVNCAAFTAGRRLRERARSRRLRGQRRRRWATWPRRPRRPGRGCVHVSTDYVFDGTRARALPRGRADRVRCSVYGAEQARRRARALAYDARAGGAHELALRPRRPQLRGHHACGLIARRQGAAAGGRRPGGRARPTRRSWRAALLDLAPLGPTRRGPLPQPRAGLLVRLRRARSPRLWSGSDVEVVPVTTAEFPRPARGRPTRCSTSSASRQLAGRRGRAMGRRARRVPGQPASHGRERRRL